MSTVQNLAAVHPFVLKLRSSSAISDEEEQALAGMLLPARTYTQDQDVLVDAERPASSVLIVSGWACRYKQLENGKRQILSFLVPGDLTEPFGALPEVMDHSIGALTELVIAPIDVAKARQLAAGPPGLQQALWWDLLVGQSGLYERILSLGRRSAVERLGHLFCDLYVRLGRVGLVYERGYDMPVSQADLADLLGLSTVHVNRSLQELRLSGMISVKGRRVQIHDLVGLKDASFFDSGYFHFHEDVLR